MILPFKSFENSSNLNCKNQHTTDYVRSLLLFNKDWYNLEAYEKKIEFE